LFPIAPGKDLMRIHYIKGRPNEYPASPAAFTMTSFLPSLSSPSLAFEKQISSVWERV